MRILTTLATAEVIAVGVTVQTKPYGPGVMGNDQHNGSYRGSGYGMMDGSGNTAGYTWAAPAGVTA